MRREKHENIENIIEEVKRTIVEGIQPEMIVLFGSYASGKPHIDSDLDILVVKESNLRFDERPLEIYDLFDRMSYPMDIIVYTPQEAREYRRVKGSFLSKILKTGKILYKKEGTDYDF